MSETLSDILGDTLGETLGATQLDFRRTRVDVVLDSALVRAATDLEIALVSPETNKLISRCRHSQLTDQSGFHELAISQ